MSEPDWTAHSPTCAGSYWWHHPASDERPVLVRLEALEGRLVAWFPDVPVPVPLRMLAGARWAPASSRHREGAGAGR